MKKTRTILLQALISLIPTIYLLSIWNNLPESVPTHYDSNNVANDFGSKFEMLGIILFMFAVSVGTSLLILNLNKFDPKQRYASNNTLILKISWVVIIFMTLISSFIVYQTEHYTLTNSDEFSPKYIVALVALLFAVLGNFMNNIKPNYFVGIRTPWTLEDEDNWRATHHLGSKIWFFGGPDTICAYNAFASGIHVVRYWFGYYSIGRYSHILFLLFVQAKAQEWLGSLLVLSLNVEGIMGFENIIFQSTRQGL